jgi:hypothetical protein
MVVGIKTVSFIIANNSSFQYAFTGGTPLAYFYPQQVDQLSEIIGEAVPISCIS